MICKVCGTTIKEGAEYCPVCGSGTEKLDGKTEEIDALPILMKKDSETDKKDTTDQNPEDIGGRKPFSMILGVAAIAVLAIVIGIVIGSSKSSKDSTSEQASANSQSVVEETPTATPTETPASEPIEEEAVWKAAYADYLLDEIDHAGTDVIGFSLCDLDEDEIPEVLLWYKEHTALSVVTWYEEDIATDSLGEYSTSVDGETGITWDSRNHVIYSKYDASWGDEEPRYLKLTKGKLETVEESSRQTLNHPVNYLLADAYEPTEVIVKKVLDTWDPEEDACGSEPKEIEVKEEKKEKKKEEKADAAEAPAEQTTQAAAAPQEEEQPMRILHPYSAINIRSSSEHASALVCEIDDVSTNFYYYYEDGQGYGSDGQMHLWYKVYLDNGISGWVRADLVY